MGKSRHLYRISFYDHETIYQIYARKIAESNLFGFLEVEALCFGEETSLVVDPSEEKLKHEFQGVKRSYIPMQSILRIDEVEKEGTGKAVDRNGKGNISHFPPPPLIKTDNQ